MCWALIYSGSGSVDLTGSMQINTLPFGYLKNDPAALAAWIPVAQYSRPFPNWGNINYVGNFGHGTHHEGSMTIEKRFSGGLNFTAFYTYAKSIDGTASNPYLCTCLNKARQRLGFAAYIQCHEHLPTAGRAGPPVPQSEGMERLHSGWLQCDLGIQHPQRRSGFRRA